MASIARNITKFSKKEIQELFKKAQVAYQSPELQLRLAPKTQEFGKILIITPRKVGNAPKRNLLRRRIRSIFYEEKLFETGHDAIIFLRRKALSLSFQALKNILVDSIKRYDR